MHICKKKRTFAAYFGKYAQKRRQKTERTLKMKEDRQKICGSIAILIGILLAGLMSGCQALEKKQQAGAVVEVNGHYLYRSSLDSLTVGLSGEDSMRVAQQYISQWAKDILLYDEAKAHVTYETEQMVEEYRERYRQNGDQKADVYLAAKPCPTP